MKRMWLVMSGTPNTAPVKFEGTFESLAAARRTAEEGAADGCRAYHVFECVGCYVKQINWVQPDPHSNTR